MVVFVPTVHHTGTNFTTDEILKDFHAISHRQGEWKKGLPEKPSKVRVHCEERFLGLLGFWCRKAAHIIVPIRHPAAVAASWRNRNKHLPIMAEQWKIMKTVIAPFNPLYLPIDHPDRDQYLATINKRLGVEIQTEWPVIMSQSKSLLLIRADLKIVKEVMADGFFDTFGYTL